MELCSWCGGGRGQQVGNGRTGRCSHQSGHLALGTAIGMQRHDRERTCSSRARTQASLLVSAPSNGLQATRGGESGG